MLFTLWLPIILLFMILLLSCKSLQITPKRICHMSIETTRFSMGCFWGPQKKFNAIKGVISTQTGYTGGTNPQPNYQSVCGGDGHVETIEIHYDNDLISYAELLNVFWNEQNLDQMKASVGSQYESIIWTMNPEHEQIAQLKLQALNSLQDARIGYVSIKDAADFYRAEGYHQNYLRKQLPRYSLLVMGFIADFLPNAPPSVTKAGLVALFLFVGITVGERIFDSKVEKVA